MQIGPDGRPGVDLVSAHASGTQTGPSAYSNEVLSHAICCGACKPRCSCARPQNRSSRPWRPACAERLRAVLHRSPRAFGHPTSVWTLELAAEVAFAAGITAPRVSDETMRATLARCGIRWRQAKGWITSPDPADTQKSAPTGLS
jgi:hypothetical protein